MKNLIFIVFFLVHLMCLGQTKKVTLTNASLKDPQFYPRNYTLTVQCDTVVVYNKPQYDHYNRIIDSTLMKYKSLEGDYDAIIQLNKEALAKVTEETKDLITKINTSVDSAGAILVKTKQNLDSATGSLKAANDNLTAAKTLLDQERKDKRRKLAAFGAGGFLVGVLATSLLFVSGR
jgi:hypothetical protein